MSVFTPCNTPDLLNWIEVRRIRGKFNKQHSLADVCIFRLFLCLNHSNCLFVPRRIIHYQGIFLPLRNRMRFQEVSYGVDSGPVVEDFRFTGVQFSTFLNNKTLKETFNRPGNDLIVGELPFLNQADVTVV